MLVVRAGRRPGRVSDSDKYRQLRASSRFDWCNRGVNHAIFAEQLSLLRCAALMAGATPAMTETARAKNADAMAGKQQKARARQAMIKKTALLFVTVAFKFDDRLVSRTASASLTKRAAPLSPNMQPQMMPPSGGDPASTTD